MMSNKDMSLQEVLGPVLRVLRDLDGQLVFRDDLENEFVLMSRNYLEQLVGAKEGEAQLSFDTVRPETQLDREQEVKTMVEAEDGPDFTEETYDDLALLDEGDYSEEVEEEGPLGEVETHQREEEPSELVFTSNRNQPSPPPVRVRFEPFSGELPPQLQE